MTLVRLQKTDRVRIYRWPTRITVEPGPRQGLKYSVAQFDPQTADEIDPTEAQAVLAYRVKWRPMMQRQGLSLVNEQPASTSTVPTDFGGDDFTDPDTGKDKF